MIDQALADVAVIVSCAGSSLRTADILLRHPLATARTISTSLRSSTPPVMAFGRWRKRAV